MKIIKPTIKLEALTSLVENNSIITGLNVEKVIEKAGRTCYKSEDRITEDSASKFCKMIQSKNHMSVLEHCSATFRIICDRGVSHELVRHRIASYSQESTRYVNYNGKDMEFIQPAWISDEELKEALKYYNDMHIINHFTKKQLANIQFIQSLDAIEKQYNNLINYEWKPQQARAVLPNSLKTEVVMTANFREWQHFLDLRTSNAAHPDMQVIAKMIGNELHKISSIIFTQAF